MPSFGHFTPNDRGSWKWSRPIRATNPTTGIADTDTLLGWWERDVENGLGEMPFPPEFPKMPGEPPRVQPSKKVAANWDENGEPR